MSYQPTTDFIALLRQTAGGVRTERMPGLDFVVPALARAGLITLFVGQSAPVVNQASTVWFQPAPSSWVSEGVIFLWNSITVRYEAATPTLWSFLIAAPFINLIPLPATVAPLMDGVATIGGSTQYARQDHIHPLDVSRAPINSPAFTGNPQAPTPTFGDNTTSLATTAFVQSTSGVITPIGGVVAYAGNTAPNASWQLCQGQAVSRTTFANLFAILGITYGSGDGVTTFNLPDLRGRTVAGVDGGANRLTTATMTSQLLGGTSTLGETKALATANLPAYTPSGTVALNNGISSAGALILGAGGNERGTVAGANYLAIAATFTGTAQGGTSTAFGLTQPTMELQYLIRVA